MLPIRSIAGAFLLAAAICHLPVPYVVADESEIRIPAGNYAGPLEIPQIVRYHSLPMRMNLEPDLRAPELLVVLDPRHPVLFDRVLRESDDTELQELAVESIARLAREKLTDISPSVDILLKKMQETKNTRMRHLCAQALTAADHSEAADLLLQMTSEGADPFKLVVEAALIRWKYEPAAELWESRLGDPFATQTSINLACEGLTALQSKNAIPSIISLLQNPTASIGKRMAAASAVCQLDPAQSLELARPFMQGMMFDKLLAIRLLSNARPECLQSLGTFCEDKSIGVAAAAWTALEALAPDQLVQRLPQGRQHPDAGIRMTSARIMRLFADPEKCGWLNELISDFNLEVRNVARTALRDSAVEHPELKSVIVDAAKSKIAADPGDWQGIEQSLVLLGQLYVPDCSAECISLLAHERPEVAVAAAWLMHLFPDETVAEPAIAHVNTVYRQRNARPPELKGDYTAASFQMAFLVQYAGLLQQKSLQPLIEQNFSKGANGTVVERSAAMWSIGLMNQNNPDPVLAKKFAARVMDRDSIPPEDMLVRQMSVRALGIMRAVDSANVVSDAYRIDGAWSVIPEAARWSLVLLGKEQPPPLPQPETGVGGWKLNPTQKK